MKSKKDNFYVVLLWGVVIYAVALLSYCTMKIVFKASADYISAFGSILGACAAVFAAFVAAYLFNDWKEQHNKTIIGGDARKAFTLLHNERNFLLDLQLNLDKLIGHTPKSRFTVNDDEMVDLNKELLDLHNKNRFDLAEFIFLIEDQELRNEITTYRNSIQNYINDKGEWIRNIESYDKVYEQYKTHLHDCYNLNANILNSLKKYVLYRNSEDN